MDEDDLFYLAPGFDPTSLTVPRLRNILLTHEIEYPSNAKKPQLIQLFNDELTPKAKKLLAASRRVKRSARGIVDVPSSQASTVDEDDTVEHEPAPVPATRRGGRRKTATAEPEPDPEATLIAPSTTRSRRTTARGTQSVEPVSVEPELEPEVAPEPAPAPRRRGRPSTKTPKQDSPEPEAWHKPAEDSPFTTDNPFQSGGSSPPPEVRHPDRRRRTVDPTPAADKRKSNSSRRRTDGVFPTKVEEVERSVFEVPVSRTSRRKVPAAEQESAPVGEEFVPEEALELAQQEASGQLVRPTRRRQTKSSSLVLQALLWPLVISAGFISTLWVQEKYSVGYCGVGNPPISELAGHEIPYWADSLRPECEPCPQHAECYQGLLTKCEDDFVLKHHPLTLGGLLPIPLPPTCEPDSEKARRVQHVVERAVDVLRERNAKYECGEIMPGDNKAPKSPAISQEDLKATLSAKRTKRMSQEEFDALFAEAIGEILNRDEISVIESTGTTDGTRHIRSTSRAKQSLSCAIRTSLHLLVLDALTFFRRKLAEYFWPFALILLTAGSSLYGKRKIQWRRTEEDWAKDLARQAFDRLSTHATLHTEDPESYPEPFLLVSHLRDQILAEDIGKKWVQELWTKTMGKVKKNSNVRELNQEMRKGDYGLTWEWIGPQAALPDSAGAASGRRISGYTGGGSRRSAGRFSVMPVSSPLSGLSTIPTEEDGGVPEMSERKWEESRPIY